MIRVMPYIMLEVDASIALESFDRIWALRWAFLLLLGSSSHVPVHLGDALAVGPASNKQDRPYYE